MIVLENKKIIEYFKSSNKQILLWGCSQITQTFLKENSEIKIDAIIDNNSAMERYLGYKVINLKELVNKANSVLLVHGNHCKSVFEQLKTISLDKNLEVIFSYENGAKDIIKEKLYVAFDNLNELQKIDETVDLDVERLSHLKKKRLDEKILFCIENFKEENKKALIIKYLNNYLNNSKIYIGCGEDFKDDYIHCDLRALEHVDIVCKAWEVSDKINNLTKIYSRHMLEHLTNQEAILTLKNWYKALKINGELELIVPNFDLRAKQWLECEWNIDEDDTQKEIWSIAGCWGWQRECDPLKENYNQSYWDVHKSGYNEKRITKLLSKIGFINIKTCVDEKNNLITIAYKV